MIPVLPSSARPGGSVPDAIENAYGEVPPVAPSVALYPVLNEPLGSDALEIVGGGAMTMLYVWVTFPPPLSVTLICTLANVPLTVGVPVIDPVAAPIVS